MELETLKEIWREVGANTLSRKQSKPLWEMANQKSNNLIARMKRNLFVELCVAITCFFSVAIYYSIAFHGKLNEVSWVYLILGAFFIFYYYRKNRLLNQMQCLTCKVRNHLEKQLNSLEKLVRFYLISGTAMIPFLMIFFFWLLQMKHLALGSIGANSSRGTTELIYFILITLLLTVFMWFVNKWYINKLYGRYIRRLRALLFEMEEGD